MGEALIAMKAYSYKGKRLKPGDPFTANGRDAAVLKQTKRAIAAPTAQPAPAPEPVPVPELPAIDVAAQPPIEVAPEPESMLVADNPDASETAVFPSEWTWPPPPDPVEVPAVTPDADVASDDEGESEQPPAADPPKRRGRYQRRDLRADK